jgi:hypothetical protein
MAEGYLPPLEELHCARDTTIFIVDDCGREKKAYSRDAAGVSSKQVQTRSTRTGSDVIRSYV